MKKTLQDQYLLIKEGKGHTGVFLTEAKRQFPNIVRNAATFEEAAASLITKNIITENIVSLGPINSPFDSKKKESYELAFENFLAEAKKKKENEDEKVKAEEKKVSKKVEEDASHNFDNSDEKNPDNMIFDQIMMGYYAEMKDPKNADKTMQELKDMVFKNLTKDPIFYTKDGQFGVKGLGYTTEAPGLGTPKEAKGKYKSSGYGDLKEGMGNTDPLELNARIALQRLNIASSLSLKDYSRQELIDSLRSASKDRFGVKELDDLANQLESSLEENKLRKVIREMVEGEIEEMRHLGSMFQSKLGDDKKERGEGEPKHKSVYLAPELIKKLLKNKDIKFITNNGETRLLIKKNTTINPPVTTDPREKISTPPEIITFLNNGENHEPIKGGGKFPGLNNEMFEYVGLKNVFVGGTPGDRTIRITILNPNVKEGVIGVIDNDVAPSYPINVPISYNDDKSAAHYSDDYKYDRQEGLLDVEDYLKQIEGMSKGDAFNYLEEMGLGNDEILTILKNHRPLSLRESVEKELMAINKEAEHEIIASKLEKVQALIDKKQSQITRLDEDEDMKDLTDAKKVKEISKDIKSLEKAKAKLEKMMHKDKSKTPRKEVIDEMEDGELDSQTINGITDKYNDIYKKQGNVTNQDIENIADQYPFDEKSAIMDYLNGYDPGLEFDI
jgi:hypothetical protein